ncbi:hypothetical protein [Streptomyces naganishii]|uniref:Uncharacterized protein n=1 Tax=Streptomyces naganishii JCM 4654 TaxID=1306179 RepID=A0A918XYW3_9ACTN|nr:hypothetical protein [Streptomyces naganishii]GHD84573.1 hypothetical protein GCM10010508_05190 [Streptomyces naganishii JCM 4654]
MPARGSAADASAVGAARPGGKRHVAQRAAQSRSPEEQRTAERASQARRLRDLAGLGDRIAACGPAARQRPQDIAVRAVPWNPGAVVP